MKQPISWHKECLTNVKKSCIRQIKIAQEAAEDVQRMQTRILILESQIAEAERLSKDGFDADKFMQKRKVA
jgi:hypothetical protein